MSGPLVPLATVAREWTRIGVTGFGGPPAHIALLRELMVERTRWMSAAEFQDANAACGLLPGPASTQMALFCAYRVAGAPGVLVGGIGFIAPAVVLIVALSLLFLAHHPPLWIRGAGAGAGAAVAAVAVHAARGFVAPSLARAGEARARRVRWALYVIVGLLAAVLLGPYLVLALLACGALEAALAGGVRPSAGLALVPVTATAGGLGALAWTAFKVGALSFGGGFVIIPLMQGDAVHVHHWMSNAQFLNAVALGQVTPGPVVATVAAVGYAARGLPGAGLAALVAFAPSFLFILIGGPRFERLRRNLVAQAFLDGAGPAAIGAIFGAGILLAIVLRGWQFGLLALGALALLVLRRGVVETLVGAGVIGVVVVLAGGGLPA
ncbi:MAG TPA: chromate efflux transporter [Solirubrobacteraceae bacterium]|nr:chromate efflux transporter [Solirubrobacteraceae bacterium]